MPRALRISAMMSEGVCSGSTLLVALEFAVGKLTIPPFFSSFSARVVVGAVVVVVAGAPGAAGAVPLVDDAANVVGVTVVAGDMIVTARYPGSQLDLDPNWSDGKTHEYRVILDNEVRALFSGDGALINE